MMACNKKHELKEYWTIDPENPCSSGEKVNQVMKYYRFCDIHKYLHFSDNEDALSIGDKMSKVKQLVDELNKNFAKYYSPGRNICIDESLIPWYGRGQRVYIKNKNAGYGVKEFKLATGNGYVLRVLPYISDPEISSVNADYVCQVLLQGYLKKGHVLCTDNWYTSIPLAVWLANNKTYLV
ncbi:PREDICTED: piggyBac transposable element-derived protein 4-like, partial [Rhagoletis zephyria]|uniref:piggyBac transposable element-derived protein 4-like n=1 Tax=Rhagoletis zephyria TaxID=28612 RepID=UPI00081186CC